MKRLALPLLLAAGLLAQVASAQTSSSTPVIGYYKFDVPAGTSAWVCGFVTKKEFQGAATSMTPGANSVINQTGATFGTFNSHYVEILSGAQSGLILDIISNTATSITVEGDTGAFGLAGTETYCVRKHATLGTVFASPGTFTEFTDSVTLYNDNGNPLSFFLAGAGQWVADDFSTPANDQVIYPGQGFLINSQAANVITFGGNEVSYVKSGPTKIPLYRGFLNFVGPLNPLVATQPADPLYNLVSSPTTAGALTNLRNAGFASSGLEDFTDSLTKFLQGGDLNPEQAYFTSSGDLLLDDFATVANDATLRNGHAIGVTVENADRTLTLSQQHPN